MDHSDARTTSNKRSLEEGEYLVRSSAYYYRIYLYFLSLALAALISDADAGGASRATRSSFRRAAGLEFISVLRGHGGAGVGIFKRATYYRLFSHSIFSSSLAIQNTFGLSHTGTQWAASSQCRRNAKAHAPQSASSLTPCAMVTT